MAARQIALDTETTGREVALGHRVIEIGAVELYERRPTGRRFHQYLNPERAIDAGAQAVHGLTVEFLADKPRFVEVREAFLDFIAGAELLIHNAEFDLGFLDAELAQSGSPLRVRDYAAVLDTLVLARALHPGQKNSLDALCKRYGIDHRQRVLHGALLDAELLAEVYLAMTAGQSSLALGFTATNQERAPAAVASTARTALRRVLAEAEERAAHRRWLERLARQGRRCLWLELEPDG